MARVGSLVWGFFETPRERRADLLAWYAGEVMAYTPGAAKPHRVRWHDEEGTDEWVCFDGEDTLLFQACEIYDINI